jgi:hypothetical protein
LEVQTGLKKSDKFPKIIIFLELTEYQFRLHGCMAKPEVSIQALFDLV